MRANKPIWEPLIWPQHRESYFAGEARQVSACLDSKGTYWQHDWEPLFEPDVDTSGAAAYLIAFGLAAKHENASRFFTDVLVSAIDDERIDGVTLGKALARIFAAGRLVPGRIFSCFEKVVSVSALHLEVIRTALGG